MFRFGYILVIKTPLFCMFNKKTTPDSIGGGALISIATLQIGRGIIVDDKQVSLTRRDTGSC